MCSARRKRSRCDPTSSCTATTRSSATLFVKGKRFSAPPFGSRWTWISNDRVGVALGVFGNQRFGSDKAFELVRPVIALTVRGRRSAFVFGTLPGAAVRAADRPRSRRTARPAAADPARDADLRSARTKPASQWTFHGTRLRHDVWLEWQQLNTAEHRERFDGGVNAEVTLGPHVSVPVQFHVVHEGGQLFNTGPVADSFARRHRHRAARAHRARRHDLAGAARARRSKSVPDRQQTRSGSQRRRVLRPRRGGARRLARAPDLLARAELRQGRGGSQLPVDQAGWIALRRDPGLCRGGSRAALQAGARCGDRSLGKIPPHRALLRVFLSRPQHRFTRLEAALSGS